MNNKIKTGIFCLAAFAATSLIAQPSENNKADNYSITSADIKASPELADSIQAQSSSVSMKCLVDTPKWDRWGYGNCFSVGYARNATAYFQIDNAPSNYTVYWSDSRCPATLNCSLPIRTYQSISLSATVLDHSNNTFTTTSATASYEGMD